MPGDASERTIQTLTAVDVNPVVLRKGDVVTRGLRTVLVGNACGHEKSVDCDANRGELKQCNRDAIEIQNVS